MPRTIVVTDVTEMRGGQFCVAGWDMAAGRMVRPLPGASANWPPTYIGPNQLWPGARVRFEETGAVANGDFPHRTEDTLVSTANMQIWPAADTGWIDAIAASAAPTLSAAFAAHAKWRVYDGQRYHTVVARGTNGPSLGAILIEAVALEFIRDNRGKLRALVTDDEGTYKLPVVAHQISKLYREQGLDALNAAFSDNDLHVRLGLARAYDDYPDECFVMLNGAYRIEG